ncbi:MAG TPA: protein kinase [Kofleriaceae bacterium]|nr:protein kinase [Kofleriaceae bacterium]
MASDGPDDRGAAPRQEPRAGPGHGRDASAALATEPGLGPATGRALDARGEPTGTRTERGIGPGATTVAATSAALRTEPGAGPVAPQPTRPEAMSAAGAMPGVIPASAGPGPGAASSAAFAATMMPAPSAPPVPHVLPTGTEAGLATGMTPEALSSDETLAAPAPGDPLVLPVVATTSYRADREIARGGMGRIVAAEDQRLGRPVALKELLDPAPELLGRFQREALITARLQHPGIVPVYEAGRWPSGEPFFAMKLVAGRPLDQVIADARTLTERLALLPRVAAATDAIAYAHSQRVIHRDLKPANILIGDFGETVVIDWGLAKNLDDAEGIEADHRVARAVKPATSVKRTAGHDASTLTVAGAVMGTPAYMAPEQARGEPLDQRADVFALGAMLYHLLAGVPPYNARTATDVIEAAAHGRVVPLTEVERGAPPDLVAIVLRAMAPLPIDRYGDAGELATELRRFLTGQLVSTHRYTAGQRIGRFVRRHRAAVMIAALAVAGFAAGGTFAVRRIVHERDVADQARQLADTRRRAAEHLIDRMQSDMKARLQQIGRLDLLASLGTEIRDYYGTLANIPGGMPADDVDRMADAIDLVGLAERESGKLDRALAIWTEARATLAAAVGGATGERRRAERRMIARLDFEIGTIHQQRGKLDAAIRAYTQAEHELDALRDEGPGDRGVLLAAAETHDQLGDLWRNDGKVDQALEQYTEAKSERERAMASPGGRPQEELLGLSTSHLKLGSVYQARGEGARAEAEYRAALKLRETQLASERDSVDVQNKVLEVQLTLGDLQRLLGDPASAIATYDKALPVMDALTRHDPANTTWRRLRGNLESDYGFALLDAGNYRAGLEQLGVAIATQQELVNRDPQSTTWQGDLSRSYTRAGDAHLDLGDHERGIARYQQALEIRRELIAKEPRSAPFRRSMAWSYAKLANAYAYKGDVARAIAAHEEALALRAKLVEESPGPSGFRNELASTEAALGELLATGDARRSQQLIADALARSHALVAGDPRGNEANETLTQCLLAQAGAARAAGDAAARERALNEALAVAQGGAERAPHNVHWPGLIAEVQAGFAELYASRRDSRAAAAAWKAVRDQLEPLATDGRLTAQRRLLLERARAGR